MSAAGKVCTGFSKPYVALYSASGTTLTYTSGQKLARGVDVSIEPESSDDNKFYADNFEAETKGGKFSGGTLSLTVDGLLQAAESLIMGLPAADSDGWVHYGDSQEIPFVGIGYIARYMSDGEESYVPTVIPKCIFNQISDSAATSEGSINFQTQSLTAKILRSENANRDWRIRGDEEETEAAAEAAIKTMFSIT